MTAPLKSEILLAKEEINIVDTGLTVGYHLDYLGKRKPSSLRLCALFDKPSRKKIPIPIDYRGFNAPDRSVEGYGLDYDDRFRQLPDLCVVADCSEYSHSLDWRGKR